MKPKNIRLAAIACASLLGSAALSQAEVIASDDFSGSIDAGFTSLIGKGGGTGFSSNWSDAGFGSNIYNPAGTPLGISPARRDLSVTIGDTGTIWVSFDWSCQDDTNGANTGASQEWGTFSFFNGASEIFAVGNPYQNNTWRLNGVDSGISNVGARKTGVIEFTLGAGATDSAKLWVGPTGSPVDVSGAAAATVAGFDLNGVNAIRIMGPAEQTFDNLLIGETMGDVAATGTPPPVSTSGTWTNTAGGTWGTAVNWLDDIVATGSESTADFSTLDILADTTVDLDSARTIGNLTFGDTDTLTAAGWTLTNSAVPANILTLAGTTPTITVNALGETKTVEISARIAGSAGLTKAGSGTLALSAANPYTGPTAVNSGTLLISGQPYFNVGRTITIASGAVLELNNSNNTFTSLMPVSTVSGAGTFRLSGNSIIYQELNGSVETRLTFAMDPGGLIDLQDTAILRNGGWKELDWTNNKASMNIASGATLDMWDGLEIRIDALTGSGTVDKFHGDGNNFMLTVGVADGSGTFSGTIQNTSGGGTLALTKTGTGSQTLSGVNTYIGNTTVEDGTLSIPAEGSLRFRPTTNGQTNVLSGSATATLSYLGTVDLDLSAASLTDGNLWTLVDIFSFSGPVPTFTPAAVTSTLGAFSENSPGIWELIGPVSKWTLNTEEGTLLYEVTATDYEVWGLPYGLTAGSEGGDLDNDGVNNFTEYAFGLIPNNGTSLNAISTLLDKSTGTFSYTRRADSGLLYSVWFSTNLAGWTEDTNAFESSSVFNGEVETVTISLSTIPGDPLPDTLFIQVRAN